MYPNRTPTLAILALLILLAPTAAGEVGGVPHSGLPADEMASFLHAVRAMEAEASALRQAHPDIFTASDTATADEEELSAEPFGTLGRTAARLADHRIRLSLGAPEGQDESPIEADVNSWVRDYRKTIAQRLVVERAALSLMPLPESGAALEGAVWRATSVPDLEVQKLFLDEAAAQFAAQPRGTLSYAQLAAIVANPEITLVYLDHLPPHPSLQDAPVSDERLAALREATTYSRPISMHRNTDYIEKLASNAAGEGNNTLAFVYTVYAERAFHEDSARHAAFRLDQDLAPAVRVQVERWSGTTPSILLADPNDKAVRLLAILDEGDRAGPNNAGLVAASVLGGYAVVALLRGDTGNPASVHSGSMAGATTSILVATGLAITGVVVTMYVVRRQRS